MATLRSAGAAAFTGAPADQDLAVVRRLQAEDQA